MRPSSPSARDDGAEAQLQEGRDDRDTAGRVSISKGGKLEIAAISREQRDLHAHLSVQDASRRARNRHVFQVGSLSAWCFGVRLRNHAENRVRM